MSWMSDAIALNRKKLENRASRARQKGNRWLVECGDLWDAHDEDAGVYFVECVDEQAVHDTIVNKGPDNDSDRVLGIFDLERPLDEQGGGVTREAWMAGGR